MSTIAKKVLRLRTLCARMYAASSATVGRKPLIVDCTQTVNHVHLACHPQPLQIALQQLIAGEVIALPTDTVYGLACAANNEQAIQKLYSIKGRNALKPVALCVKDLDAFRRYSVSKHLSDELLERLVPGPITIVVERSIHLSNRFLNPSTSKIGIRIPDFAFIQQLCTLLDCQPLALTSANRSSEPSSLNTHEFSDLWCQLGAVFDAGALGNSEDRRSASTVVDLATHGYYKVIREGVALKKTLDVLHDFGLQMFENR